MKKILLFFLLLFPLSACTQNSTSSPKQLSSMYTISSWSLLSTPQRKDDPNIPNCETLDLKPINPKEIINIDDVVQNCSYETGHIVYNPYREKTKYIFQPIFIRKNTITSNDFYQENKIICEDKWVKYRELRKQDLWMKKLISNHYLQEKNLVNTVLPETNDDKETIFTPYKCKEKRLCTQLVGKIAWENKEHYFLYGTNDFSNRWGLIIDDKLYNIWEIHYIQINSKDSEFIETWYWIVDQLFTNKVTVKRYVSGSFSEKYKKDPNLIYSEENEKKITREKWITIWTFQLQTCEIPL